MSLEVYCDHIRHSSDVKRNRHQTLRVLSACCVLAKMRANFEGYLASEEPKTPDVILARITEEIEGLGQRRWPGSLKGLKPPRSGPGGGIMPVFMHMPLTRVLHRPMLRIQLLHPTILQRLQSLRSNRLVGMCVVGGRRTAAKLIHIANVTTLMGSGGASRATGYVATGGLATTGAYVISASTNILTASPREIGPPARARSTSVT
jgi:hypothetical protein